MTDLTGRFILVVEDEPLVALNIAECLQSEGASVHTAHRLANGFAWPNSLISRPQSLTIA